MRIQPDTLGILFQDEPKRSLDSRHVHSTQKLFVGVYRHRHFKTFRHAALLDLTLEYEAVLGGRWFDFVLCNVGRDPSAGDPLVEEPIERLAGMPLGRLFEVERCWKLSSKFREEIPNETKKRGVVGFA